MANPFHDETGKFCSENEMQNAVNKLAKAGKVEEYFTLRTELENIRENKVTVSKNLLTAYVGSGANFSDQTIATLTTEDKIALHDLIDWNDKSTIPNSYVLMSRLDDRSLPKSIREDILHNAPLGSKEDIMQRAISDFSPISGEDIKELVKGETEGRLASLAFRSNKLTFEDKYNMAKQVETGLADLAYTEPKIFFSEPELVDELRAQTAKLVKEGSSSASTSVIMLARYSKNESDHDMAIENYGKENIVQNQNNLAYSLTENLNLSAVTGIKLYQKIKEANISSFLPLAEDLSSKQSLAGRTSKRAYKVISTGSVSLTTGSTPEALKQLHSEARTVNPDTESLSEHHKRESVEAEFYSYKENFDKLEQQVKQLRKRNAPKRNDNGETLSSLIKKQKLGAAWLQATRFIKTYEQFL